MGISDKIETIAKEIYGAGSVSYSPAAKRRSRRSQEMGFGDLPVSHGEDQYSLSDDQKKLGRPEGFDLTSARCVCVRGRRLLWLRLPVPS